MDFSRYFRKENTRTYTTMLKLNAYRRQIEKLRRMHVSQTETGIHVHWEYVKNLRMAGTCEFIPEEKTNMITVTTQIREFRFYQLFVFAWAILAPLWLFLAPTAQTVKLILSVTVFVLLHWTFLVYNRNRLLTLLAPNNPPNSPLSK